MHLVDVELGDPRFETWSAVHGAFNVADTSVEASLLEGHEAVMPVEGDGAIIDRVHDDRSGSVVASPGERAPERFLQEVGAEARALLVTVEREPGEQQHRYRVGAGGMPARRSLPVTGSSPS